MVSEFLFWRCKTAFLKKCPIRSHRCAGWTPPYGTSLVVWIPSARCISSQYLIQQTTDPISAINSYSISIMLLSIFIYLCLSLSASTHHYPIHVHMYLLVWVFLYYIYKQTHRSLNGIWGWSCFAVGANKAGKTGAKLVSAFSGYSPTASAL